MEISCPRHHGMAVLDREQIQRSFTAPAVRVPAVRVKEFKSSPVMKRLILDLPNIRNVESDPENPKSNRLVLLNALGFTLDPDAQEYVNTKGLGMTQFEVKLGYDYWNLSQILESILPLEATADGVPSSFTQTGHIAHFNLREQHLPHKHLIGQIVLDKNKNIRTVVNKVDTIDTEFRVFKMEVIAGDEDFNVELRESECTFHFDFSKVYWNSRLQLEHDRLIAKFGSGQVIADVFAGVGPFAVPAAKKGCFVLGNDLNPESSKWMQHNAELNKVEERLRVSCRDGREFIRASAKEIYDNPIPYSETTKAAKQRDQARRKARTKGEPEPPAFVPPPPKRSIDHFVMNLPATAVEFLDAFRGVLVGLEQQYQEMPWVHCHAFSKEPMGYEGEMDVKKRAEDALGASLGIDQQDWFCHLVRDVAPNKQMYCISFRLPREVAFAPPA